MRVYPAPLTGSFVSASNEFIVLFLAIKVYYNIVKSTEHTTHTRIAEVFIIHNIIMILYFIYREELPSSSHSVLTKRKPSRVPARLLQTLFIICTYIITYSLKQTTRGGIVYNNRNDNNNNN